jgi:uncharacterized protein (DUF58 family)
MESAVQQRGRERVAQLRTLARGFVALLSVLLAFALLSDGPTALPPPPAKSSAALSADDGAPASAVATPEKRRQPAAVTRPQARTSKALRQPPQARRRQAAEAAEDMAGELLPVARRHGAHRHRPGEIPAALQVFRC